MRNLTLILSLIFTVTLSSCKTTSTSSMSSDEWKKIGVTPDGDTYYVNLDKIEEREGFVFFTGLQDNLKPFIGHNYPTVMSGAIYFQGDCGEFRLKPIRTSAYGKSMGQEHIETKDFPKSAWHQIPPESLQGVMLRKVCNH